MASQSANIHPTKEWKSVNMEFRGDGVGRCVNLTICDPEHNEYRLHFHYGYGDPAEFVQMIKDAAANLEITEEEDDGEE